MTGSSSVSTSPPQGAPPSKLLFEILKLLVSEREASLIALVPIRPFTVETASRAWRMSVPEAQNALDALASRQMKSRYLETLSARLRL